MENLKKEFEEKIEKILHVFMFAQEAYVYTEYFHNPATQDELDLVTKSVHKGNLSTIMHIMFRSLIVEVCKLFSPSPSDKFTLIRFVNSLSTSGHFRKIGVSQVKVESWKRLLLNNSQTIDNILLLRDKMYAHADNPMIDYSEIDLSFKEIKTLLGIAEEILKNLYTDVLNVGLSTNPMTFDRKRFKILELLAKGEQARLNEIKMKWTEWANNRSSV